MVVEDLLAVFIGSIINLTAKMNFVNGKALDDAGESREVYTALLDRGVMPVRLSTSFILARIHGIDSVDGDILMTSFLDFLPPVKRSAVEKALQGTMEESDEEELLDIFTRIGSHFLLPNNNMKPAVETMAHNAILQGQKYIVDCFSTPMEHVQLKLSDQESVLSLYESKKATGKRQLLCCLKQ